jgi:beta-phosphoglucomutase-like phosphatase (HAD superfamily)
MNVDTQNCLVIEDSPRGAMAGIAAGMTVFGYAGSTNSDALIDVGCAQVFDTMEELEEYFRR